MSSLRVRPEGKEGRVHHVTPKSANWSHVGFDLYRLSPGEPLSNQTFDREVCLVLVSGKAELWAGEMSFGVLGQRMSPFDGPPAAVYVPADSHWRIEAETAVELAVCSAPGMSGVYAPRLIKVHDQIERGRGTNLRRVTNILPETDPAHALLVVEVITPPGHSSSYPPHKHDTDNLPHESLLEETYYHRLNPPQGFAFQRVYTDDRSLDEAIVIEDGDVTLVPKGYHPCGTLHGYALYYLNVMAGPHRVWKFHNDPDHEWMMG
jgi:5-deoxy-glucuronate isomerase